MITRTTNDVQQIQTLINLSLDILFKTPFTVIWVLVKVVGRPWQWMLAVAIAVAIMVIGIVIIMLMVRQKVKALQAHTDSLNQVTRDNIGGIRVVRAYNAEGYQEEKFETVNEGFTKATLFTSRTLALMGPFLSLIMNVLLLLIYWIGAGLINEADRASYSDIYSEMVVFVSYVMVIVSAFTILSVVFTVAPRALVSARRIAEVLQTKESMHEGPGVGETEERGTVEFRDVYFRYPGGHKDILSGISFKANRGDTIAFIGSTGCGKSSVIKLVPRLYEVTGGEVLVDGRNVKDYRKDELSKKIGYVAQKAVMFSGNIRDNVNFGDNDADEETIKKAIDISQSTDFVMKKKGGLGGTVGQNGINFSGGQKQRLSIARAIARQAEIYIFDDAFSALDYRTDRDLRAALREQMGDVTCLIVAQRIPTIIEADRIIVLDDGKVVGQGTHSELMQSCALYQEIARSQLSEEELS